MNERLVGNLMRELMTPERQQPESPAALLLIDEEFTGDELAEIWEQIAESTDMEETARLIMARTIRPLDEFHKIYVDHGGLE